MLPAASVRPSMGRLALGTVQFGLDYGVASRPGQVSFEEARGIVHDAAELGINTLDTAVGYGESEDVLGRIGVSSMRVVTKLPAIPDTISDVGAWIGQQVEASMRRLKVARLHAILLHRPAQLLEASGGAIYAALDKLRGSGLTSGIGVSVYGPSELDALCSRYDFDVVQAPTSIIDRRLTETGWAKRLRDRGTELHVRSIFLQGLLLMDPNTRPAFFSRWPAVWTEWHCWLQAAEFTPLEACLNYALSLPDVDRVVVGVDSRRQLQQIATVDARPLPDLPQWPPELDGDLINPARWQRQ